MLSGFLASNRDELIRRCAAKVAVRPRRRATEVQLAIGVPLFLTQLQRALETEDCDPPRESLLSGASGKTATLAETGLATCAHGRQLLALGFSVDQVVHDYGDLSQAITDLAFECSAPFAIAEFRTLYCCLDNAIASAVSAFSEQRDVALAARQNAEVTERLDGLVHELRSSLATATYAVAALELGNLPMSGSTGAVLKRSLQSMRAQIGGPTPDQVWEGTGSGA